MRLPPPSGAKPSVGSTSEAVSQARRLQRETGVTACKHLRDLSHRAEVLLLPVLPEGFQGGFVALHATRSRTAIRRRLFMAPSSDHVLYNQIEDE